MKHHNLRDKLRDCIFPFILPLSAVRIKYKVNVINKCNTIPDKPVIYACNHSQFSDIPMAIRAIGRRSYILMGKQKLYIADYIFFNLLGAVWVDRKDKKDRAVVKNKILNILDRGQSVLWFPEGTWNLSDNILMLPMRWGIIETAHKADAQIIPMALMYDRDKKECYAKFSEPIYGEQLTDCRNGIQLLRDSIATLRYELMEECTEIQPRYRLSSESWQRENKDIIAEYPPLDWKYEKSVIYKG